MRIGATIAAATMVEILTIWFSRCGKGCNRKKRPMHHSPDIPDSLEKGSHIPGGDPQHRVSAQTAALFVCPILLVLIAAYCERLPAPLAADAPPDVFSAGRAVKHLEFIAREPRPMGSRRNAEVRDYLVAQLRGLGLEVQVQVSDAPPKNVIGRLKGTASTGAILLMAHYDSVPDSPGACDNGGSVAGLLETVCVLKEGQALKNDVLVLFTDGEELGVQGARIFRDSDPWVKDVALVFNFEGTGHGPLVLIETSTKNGRLMKEFVRGVPRPYAASLSEPAWQLEGSNTDFSVFRDTGFSGMSFNCPMAGPYAHVPEDSVRNVEEASLQHMGACALALVRRFGNADLKDIESPPVAFFTLLSRFVFYYPVSWTIPLAALPLVLFAGLLSWGLWSGNLSWGRILMSALAIVLCSAVVVCIVQQCWAWALADFKWGQFFSGDWRAAVPLAVTALLTYVALMAALSVICRYVSAQEAAVFPLACWAALLLLTVGLDTPSSPVFFWPFLGGVVGWGCSFRFRKTGKVSWGTLGILCLLQAPGFLLLTSILPHVLTVFPEYAATAVIPITFLVGLWIPLVCVRAALREPRSASKRRNRVFLVILVVLVTGMLGPVLLVLTYPLPDLEPLLAELEEQGAVLDRSDLHSTRPEDTVFFSGPPEDSAFAFLLSNEAAGPDSGVDPKADWAWYNASEKAPRAYSLSSEEQAEVRAAVEANKALIDRLKAVAAFPPTRIEDVVQLSGFDGAVAPNSRAVHSLMNLLLLDALVAHEEGRNDEALATCESALHFAGHVRDHPFLLSQLLALNHTEQVMVFFSKLLSHSTLSRKSCSQLDDVIVQSSRREALPQSFYLELISNRKHFNPEHGQRPDGPLIRSLRRWIRVWDEETMITVYHERAQLAHLPYFQARAALAEIHTGVRLKWLTSYGVQWAIQDLGRYIRAQARCEALLDQARIALALHACYQDYAAYPDGLAALSPMYLPEVPIDVFSGGEMRYSKKEESYLLYSVGANGLDDMAANAESGQGQEYETLAGTIILPGDDMVWGAIPVSDSAP